MFAPKWFGRCITNSAITLALKRPPSATSRVMRRAERALVRFQLEGYDGKAVAILRNRMGTTAARVSRRAHLRAMLRRVRAPEGPP